MPRSPIAWTAIWYPASVRLHDVVLELLLWHHRQAEVVVTRVILERNRDGGRPADQRAIDEHLDRPDPESVAAHPLLDAEADDVRQQILANHHARPELQQPSINGDLIRLDVLCSR